MVAVAGAFSDFPYGHVRPCQKPAGLIKPLGGKIRAGSHFKAFFKKAQKVGRVEKYFLRHFFQAQVFVIVSVDKIYSGFQLGIQIIRDAV